MDAEAKALELIRANNVNPEEIREGGGRMADSVMFLVCVAKIESALLVKQEKAFRQDGRRRSRFCRPHNRRLPTNRAEDRTQNHMMIRIRFPTEGDFL